MKDKVGVAESVSGCGCLLAVLAAGVTFVASQSIEDAICTLIIGVVAIFLIAPLIYIVIGRKHGERLGAGCLGIGTLLVVSIFCIKVDPNVADVVLRCSGIYLLVFFIACCYRIYVKIKKIKVSEHFKECLRQLHQQQLQQQSIQQYTSMPKQLSQKQLQISIENKFQN